MRKKLIIGFILLNSLCFGKYLNIQEDINEVLKYFPRYECIVDDKENMCIVDMQKVLWLTAGCESHFSEFKYSGRVAKTYMQLEEESIKWARKVNAQEFRFVEKGLGRKLDYQKDEDAMFLAYLLYSTKLKYHKARFFKQAVEHREDLEWRMYKVYYNTYKGSAKYSLWKIRSKKELTN